jgi:hypothetical protein
MASMAQRTTMGAPPAMVVERRDISPRGRWCSRHLQSGVAGASRLQPSRARPHALAAAVHRWVLACMQGCGSGVQKSGGEAHPYPHAGMPALPSASDLLALRKNALPAPNPPLTHYQRVTHHTHGFSLPRSLHVHHPTPTSQPHLKAPSCLPEWECKWTGLVYHAALSQWVPAIIESAQKVGWFVFAQGPLAWCTRVARLHTRNRACLVVACLRWPPMLHCAPPSLTAGRQCFPVHCRQHPRQHHAAAVDTVPVAMHHALPPGQVRCTHCGAPDLRRRAVHDCQAGKF